jgi:hypothetical protein
VPPWYEGALRRMRTVAREPAAAGADARAGGRTMKQCIRCEREYPDSENFCEMDGAYLLSLDDSEGHRREHTPRAMAFRRA